MYLFFLKIFRLNDNILIFLIVKYIGLMKIILIEKKKICLYLFFYKKNYLEISFNFNIFHNQNFYLVI